jgi:hypothetical protein
MSTADAGTRWSLQPLCDRDAKSGNMLTAFDFNQ